MSMGTARLCISGDADDVLDAEAMMNVLTTVLGGEPALAISGSARLYPHRCHGEGLVDGARVRPSESLQLRVSWGDFTATSRVPFSIPDTRAEAVEAGARDEYTGWTSEKNRRTGRYDGRGETSYPERR
jgi:hypothetical protein